MMREIWKTLELIMEMLREEARGMVMVVIGLMMPIVKMVMMVVLVLELVQVLVLEMSQVSVSRHANILHMVCKTNNCKVSTV